MITEGDGGEQQTQRHGQGENGNTFERRVYLYGAGDGFATYRNGEHVERPGLARTHVSSAARHAVRQDITAR